MTLNVKEAAEILGESIVGEDDSIEVEGAGAQVDDFRSAQAE
jgi:hypothetical protein